MIWPSLHYPLAVSSISEKAAIGITKKLFKALLPKLGANHVYPTELCFPPPALFGLWLPNLYWEQGATALRLFLKVSNGFLADSHLLKCSLEQAQLELGLSTPFFQANYSQYGFLMTDCWVKFLWSFLAYVDCSLSAESPFDLDLQRVNDQFLMDIFSSSGQFLDKDLVSINRCCLAKRFLTVADICSGDGTHIRWDSILPNVAPFPSTLIWQ